MKTYELLEDGRAIRCLMCQRTSRNAQDVAARYCGHCHKFHEPIADANDLRILAVVDAAVIRDLIAFFGDEQLTRYRAIDDTRYIFVQPLMSGGQIGIGAFIGPVPPRFWNGGEAVGLTLEEHEQAMLAPFCDIYQFESYALAVANYVAYQRAWTEPAAWCRHPSSRRRRPGGDPAQEFVRE